MPIYELRCDKCLATTEVHRPINASLEQERHEVCGENMRQIYHSPAVVYQGSGFAKKDRKGGSSHVK